MSVVFRNENLIHQQFWREVHAKFVSHRNSSGSDGRGRDTCSYAGICTNEQRYNRWHNHGQKWWRGREGHGHGDKPELGQDTWDCDHRLNGRLPYRRAFPGKYTVTVSATGFSELKVSDVDVRG